jgi:hypothetical protein
LAAPAKGFPFLLMALASQSEAALATCENKTPATSKLPTAIETNLDIEELSFEVWVKCAIRISRQ